MKRKKSIKIFILKYIIKKCQLFQIICKCNARNCGRKRVGAYRMQSQGVLRGCVMKSTLCRHKGIITLNAQFQGPKQYLKDIRIHTARNKQQKRHFTRASIVNDAVITLVEQPPLRDALAFVGAAAASKLLIKTFEKLEHEQVIDKVLTQCVPSTRDDHQPLFNIAQLQTLSRKLVHTLAGPLFIIAWPCFSSSFYAPYIAACVPLINGIRLVLVGSSTIKDDRMVSAVSRTGDPQELLRGPLYYVIILSLVTAFYWRTSPAGLIVASLMCGGDGLADIVGRRFGSTNRLPWNPSKSWVGSASMFLGGFFFAIGLLWYFSTLQYMSVDWSSTTSTVAAIALVATVIESLPVNQTIDDNLSVPGVAALMGAMFQVSFAAIY